MAASRKKKQKVETLSDRAVFDMVATFEVSKERQKTHEAKWREIQQRIVAELKRRRIKSLSDDTLTKVTLVQPERVVYDSDGLWADLSPARRRSVFDRQVNLSALPREVQADLMKHLTRTQRKQVVSHKLNEDKLAQAVQDGKVAVELVSEHSEIKESAPYISVSRGSAR